MPDAEAATFLPRAQAALAAFAARPGYVRGRVGRAADDPTQWVLTTEWSGVGAYRRSLGAYDVKVDAAPLLSLRILALLTSQQPRDQAQIRAKSERLQRWLTSLAPMPQPRAA